MAGNVFSPKAAQRAALEATRRAAMGVPSAEVCARLIGLPIWAAGQTVGLYGAQGFEVELTSLHHFLRRRGIQVAYPRMQLGSRVLRFCRLERPNELELSSRGLPRPPLSAPEVLSLDVVVAPGVAFTRRGDRLGRGGGYYDATFGTSPQAIRVGVTPESGLVDVIATDEWDVRMHWVVTESQVIEVSSA
jgi:5-formyltetrahydrofolate cyclo-ligase